MQQEQQAAHSRQWAAGSRQPAGGSRRQAGCSRSMRYLMKNGKLQSIYPDPYLNPVIAQLAEHLTVDVRRYLLVPGSIPGDHIDTEHDHVRCVKLHLPSALAPAATASLFLVGLCKATFELSCLKVFWALCWPHRGATRSPTHQPIFKRCF